MSLRWLPRKWGCQTGTPVADNGLVAQSWEGFDGFVGLLDYPMVIVTAQSADGPAGCLVGFDHAGAKYRSHSIP